MKKKYHDLTAIIKDKKGNVLSIGKNSYFKSHPLMYKLNKEIGIKNPVKVYLHAEVDAIIKCKEIDKAYSIEVYRISENIYRKSKPCKLCLTAIRKTNIKKLLYIDENGNIVVERL